MAINEYLDPATGYFIFVSGPDSLGMFVAHCPSLKGCLGYAATPIRAAQMSADAIKPIVSALKSQGRNVPEPDEDVGADTTYMRQVSQVA